MIKVLPSLGKRGDPIHERKAGFDGSGVAKIRDHVGNRMKEVVRYFIEFARRWC